MQFITIVKSSACGPTETSGFAPIDMQAVKRHPTPGCLLIELMADRIEANERAKITYKAFMNLSLGEPLLRPILPHRI